MHDSWNKPRSVEQDAVSGFGIDVRDFGSVKGDNFRDTLDRAVRSAYIETGAPDDQKGPGVSVLIPGGAYRMGNTTLNFPGSYPKYTPGLRGLGDPGCVTLLWENTLQGPWISTGDEIPDRGIENATLFQTFQNIELRAWGGVSAYGGIKSRFGILQRFSDIYVRGLTDRNQPWDAGIGFDFRHSAIEASNHQHLRLERCYSNFNQIGYWFGEATWSATLLDVHANGAAVAGAMYDAGAVVAWIGGCTQSAPANPSSVHWMAGTKQAIHQTGASRTDGMPSGVGGTMGASSGQFTTITGLSGLTGYEHGQSTSHEGMWLEARRTSAPWTNDDRVSGLYKIYKVLSPTSCVIRKAVNPQPGASITWQVRCALGGYNVTLNGIYHEGDVHALISLGPDVNTSSRFKVTGCETGNIESTIDAVGVTGMIHCEGTAAGGSANARLRRVSSYNTDQRITSVDTDSFSRAGLRAAMVNPSAQPTALWDAMPRATRYNSALKERGFVFAVDARKSASIVRSGNNITSWSDFISSNVGARLNTGVAPQYIALDSALGTPAVRLTGAATRALVGALTWSLTSLFTAGRDIEPTVIMIARLADTVQCPLNRRVRLHAVASDFSINVHWNDGQFAADSVRTMFYKPPGAGVTGSLLAVDTLPHVIVSSAHCAGRTSAGAGSDVTPWLGALTSYGFAPFGFVGGESCSLSVGDPSNDGVVGDLIVSHIAVAPFGITDEERGYFIDLARSEFNVGE